jgi:hypothetical protein
MRLVFPSILVALLLTACGAPRQIESPAARRDFPENEYLALPTTGKATLRGQAFLKTRGGDVKTAAGSEVALNPVTSYSNEWYNNNYLRNMRMEPPDSRVFKYIKTVVADGSGHFTFKNVPNGEYYITTKVMWEAPTGYQGSLQQQGGLISKKITIKNDEDFELILTK